MTNIYGAKYKHMRDFACPYGQLQKVYSDYYAILERHLDNWVDHNNHFIWLGILIDNQKDNFLHASNYLGDVMVAAQRVIRCAEIYDLKFDDDGDTFSDKLNFRRRLIRAYGYVIVPPMLSRDIEENKHYFFVHADVWYNGIIPKEITEGVTPCKQ